MSSMLRGGMANDTIEASLSHQHSLNAPGSVEDASWDIPESVGDGKLHGEEGRSVSCWTINTGGLEGTWKVLHLVESLAAQARPDILFMQEVSCTESQWLAIQSFVKKYGFKGYMTGGRAVGGRKDGLWHRGIITLLDDRFSSSLIHEETWEKGQFHSLKVGDTMMINSYVVPTEEAIIQHVQKLEAHLVQADWCGKWLWVGDWNEEFEGSWIATLALMYGGTQAEVSLMSSTRWNGARIIDYPISNFEVNPCFKRLEAVSDHCIIEFLIPEGPVRHENHLRFSPEKSFEQPMWLAKKRWHQLFSEAFDYEEMSGWNEACFLVEHHCKWDECENEEQMMVDYLWTFTCARMTSTFKRGFWLSLLEVPEGYDNIREIERVTYLANYAGIKGAEVKMQNRTLPKDGAKSRIKFAKVAKKIGRLTELARRLERKQFDNETRCLKEKLYGEEDVNVNDVRMELSRLSLAFQKSNDQEKKEKLANWRQRLKSNIAARADWLNKKGSTKSPVIANDQDIAGTKNKAVSFIYEYWQSFWNNQQGWDENALQQRADAIQRLLGVSFEGQRDEMQQRPQLDLFRQRLMLINGCPGADGWSKHELKMVAGHEGVAAMVWNTMGLWEDTQRIPGAIKHCKLICIPKKDQRQLKPSELRPISVLSVWWRVWSSTWLRTKTNTAWIKALFPKHSAGGLPGSYGAEDLSSVIAHQVAKLGHAVTLDLTHAFDSVNLRMMEVTMKALLPKVCLGWCSLLFDMWKSMSRWIVFDGAVHSSPLVTDHGIPQGDPAGPLIMNVLMLAMKNQVDTSLDVHAEDAFHVLYMDDRTYVGKSFEAVRKAQNVWAQTATWFNLKENAEKAQYVNTEKRYDSFEVLGAVIGTPGIADISKSRTKKRMDKAKVLYKKIGLLPQGMSSKLCDAGIFVKGVLEYGWVSQCPTKLQTTSIETALWSSVGKTRHSSLRLRRILAGGHTSLKMVSGLKQLRLLAKRDQILNELGIQKQGCLLDTHVSNFLEGLQWTLHDDTYRHELLRESFCIRDLVDKSCWERTAHLVRESYRWQSYLQFCAEDRHEIRGKAMPVYSSSRRQSMMRWIRNDSTAILAAVGGIQSPLLKHRLRGINSMCSCCLEEPNPSWEHIWRCSTGQDMPDDPLLARFLWPRDVRDHHLCEKFLNCLRSID